MKKKETAQRQREILAENLNSLLKKKRLNQADVIRDLEIPEATAYGYFYISDYSIMLNYRFITIY